jgi:hypothetical protein
MDKASTITMTASLSWSINIAIAFEILPILVPYNPDGTKFIHPENTRNKIPYFGVENAIVCVKYKGKIRGIRQNVGQMNNVVSVDLQVYNKNVNLKLARNKVQLTGATSEDMGRSSFEVLCSHINMIQSHIDHIRELSYDVKNYTMQWVLNKVNANNDNSITKIPHEEIQIQAENNEFLDLKFASFLYQFSNECDTFMEYYYKFNKIVEICSSKENVILEDTSVYISNCKISNSVYNYSLELEEKDISLLGLSKFLYQKGFSVDYHPLISTHLKIVIPLEISTEKEEPFEDCSSSSNKIKAHRFSIHRGGVSIKQTSPSNSKIASQAREKLLKAIYEYKQED